MEGEALASYIRMAAFIARNGDMQVKPAEALAFQHSLNILSEEYDLDRNDLRHDAEKIVAIGRDWDLDSASEKFLEDANYLLNEYKGSSRLMRFHTEFTTICMSDGAVNPGEQFILDEVRKIWELPDPIQ